MLLMTLIVGLLGATLMFCGDMMLYYDKNDFEQSGSLEPIVAIMKTLPRKRVMLGGWIGPVAAFLYCIGFYHIVLIAEESCHTLAFCSLSSVLPGDHRGWRLPQSLRLFGPAWSG